MARHRKNDDLSRNWHRIGRIMRGMNREYGTSYTMSYVFGVPTVDRLDIMNAIHSRDDLANYLAEAGINSPAPPKVEDIMFRNLINRFNFMPEEFGNTMIKYLIQLSQTVDHSVLREAIKSIVWTLNENFHYDNNNYGRHFSDVIKAVAEELRQAEPDKTKEIDEIEEQALSAAEDAIQSSAWQDG